LKSVRRSTGEILEQMSEAEWAREGTHTEHGRYSVGRWLRIYSGHAHSHADQILAARQAAGRME
jgi:hypothetical protein